MIKTAPAVGLFLLGMSCSVTLAQSVNIDFGTAPFVKPADTYGGGANQPGFWNQVVGSRPLFGINGTTQVATINTGDYAHFQDNIPGAGAGDEALMETALIAESVQRSLSIRDLLPGEYDLYLYGWGAQWEGSGTSGITDFGVFVTGFGSGTYRLDYPSGPWPGMQIENKTFIKVPITLEFGSNGRTFLSVNQAGLGEGFTLIQGMQLVMIPAPAAPLLVALFAGAMVRRRR